MGLDPFPIWRAGVTRRASEERINAPTNTERKLKHMKAESMKNTMAVNQYGETFHALGAHPRKALLEKLGRNHASKMYRDKKDGSTVHVGYIIAGQWLELFSVQPIENKA